MTVPELPVVWVFAECRAGRVAAPVLDVVGEAARLAGQIGAGVTAVVVGDHDVSAELGAAGAGTVVRMPDMEWDGADGALPAARLATLALEHPPRMILFSGTALGRDVAPRVAIRMRTGIVADCTYLRFGADERLEATRSISDGAAAARVTWEGEGPALAIIPPGTLLPAPVLDAPQPNIVDAPVATEQPAGPKLLERSPIDPALLPLEDADVVVAGGLGMGGEEGFDLLTDLAGAMGGKVGATRRATDLGWAPNDALVGQTGKTVAPNIYVAAGISGASQHVLGMRDAGLIVSINTDPFAPIHGVADVAVVADARVFVPVLADAFRQARSEQAAS